MLRSSYPGGRDSTDTPCLPGCPAPTLMVRGHTGSWWVSGLGPEKVPLLRDGGGTGHGAQHEPHSSLAGRSRSRAAPRPPVHHPEGRCTRQWPKRDSCVAGRPCPFPAAASTWEALGSAKPDRGRRLAAARKPKPSARGSGRGQGAAAVRAALCGGGGGAVCLGSSLHPACQAPSNAGAGQTRIFPGGTPGSSS